MKENILKVLFIFILLPGFCPSATYGLQGAANVQEKHFEIVRNCELNSFDPSDPDGHVDLIEVLGLHREKCKLIIHMDRGKAEVLLPKEVYSRISSLEDLFNGECSGDCDYLQQVSSPPEPKDEGEACMDDCIMGGCSESYLRCFSLNEEKCEEKCFGPGTDVSEMSEHEKCIFECVGPELICNPAGGEVGEANPQCQACADLCTELHGSGNNCLTEEEWEAREAACRTCEHCYGEPVYGPSGDGYDCIVDARCFDASSEWGDDPGTGPASYEEGHEPSPDQRYWWETEVSDDLNSIVIVDGEDQWKVDLRVGDEVEIEDGKIKAKTREGEVEVEDRSEEVINHYANDVREVKSLSLVVEGDRPIYKLETREKAKLLGFIPVERAVKKNIDAGNLTLMGEEKPWWDFLTFDFEQEEDVCIDTDNGLNYEEDGYVYKKIKNTGVTMEMIDVIPEDYEYQDSCLDAKNLKEFYCGENQAKSISYQCGEVCYESACEDLIISDVKVEETTFYYAEISWKTNIPTSTKVIYEKLPNVQGALELKTSLELTDHSALLYAGIEPDKTYNFKAVSCYKDAFCKTSELMQFEIPPKGCVIDGVFYPDGFVHDNGCQVCEYENNAESWTNCNFQGILRLTDAGPFEADGYYTPSGCIVKGTDPDIDVGIVKDELIERRCYLEGEVTGYTEFLCSKEIPPAQEAPHGGVFIRFACQKGELSSSLGKGLPPPGEYCNKSLGPCPGENEDGIYQPCESTVW